MIGVLTVCLFSFVQIRINPTKSGVVRKGVKHSMNPFDEIALEEVKDDAPTHTHTPLASALARRIRYSYCPLHQNLWQESLGVYGS